MIAFSPCLIGFLKRLRKHQYIGLCGQFVWSKHRSTDSMFSGIIWFELNDPQNQHFSKATTKPIPFNHFKMKIEWFCAFRNNTVNVFSFGVFQRKFWTIRAFQSDHDFASFTSNLIYRDTTNIKFVVVRVWLLLETCHLTIINSGAVPWCNVVQTSPVIAIIILLRYFKKGNRKWKMRTEIHS